MLSEQKFTLIETKTRASRAICYRLPLGRKIGVRTGSSRCDTRWRLQVVDILPFDELFLQTTCSDSLQSGRVAMTSQMRLLVAAALLVLHRISVLEQQAAEDELALCKMYEIAAQIVSLEFNAQRCVITAACCPPWSAQSG